MLANSINFLTESAIFSSSLFISIFAKELGASNFEVGLIGLFVSAVSFPLQALASTFFQLLLIRVLIGFCVVIYPAALIAHIYDANKKIGKFSAFGSLGWSAGQFLAGLIAVYWKIFFLGSFFFFLAFLLALKMEIPKVSLSGVFGPLFGGLVSQYLGYLSTIYIAVVLIFFAFSFFYFTEFKKYEYEKII